MELLGRRTLLRRGAAALAVLGAGHRPGPAAAALGLQPDPAGILDLLPGFSYRIIQRVGDRMDDGFVTPGMPDGMACFDGPDGTWVLMRNHELTGLQQHLSAYPAGSGLVAPGRTVDPATFGGVTRLVVDARDGSLVASNLVLTGTERNCAGGPSPWGWLSCEETTIAGHGHVFLCPTDASELGVARRIDGYGRFRHEAAAVHAETRIAYLSEDEGDSALYRFVPVAKEHPFEGRLQAMAVVGQPGFDTSSLSRGSRREITWVDVADPTGSRQTTRAQARANGAAIVSRGEGMWIDGDDLFLCATSGGPRWRGQVFHLRLGSADGRQESIETLADGSGDGVLAMPDNLTISPQGHIYVAEDSFGRDHLRRIDLDGRVRAFARNAASVGEFAGPCFSPDGTIMFVNLQIDGLTIAIRGPFGEEAFSQSESFDLLGWAPMAGAGAAIGLGMLALIARRRRRRERQG